jgi:hypothetical protein
MASITFIVTASAYLYDRTFYDNILHFFGVPFAPNKLPFMDTESMLAQIECWRLGIDVYSFNPCDTFQRLHDQSPLWLRLWFVRTGDPAVAPTGFVVDLIFLLSLFSLFRTRVRISSGLLLTAATVSHSTAYALERANTDLLIFSLCVMALYFLNASWSKRCIGYLLIFVAAALKFYPLILISLVLREKTRAMLFLFLISSTCIAIFLWWGGNDSLRALRNADFGHLGGLWGASVLPFGIADLARIIWPDLSNRHSLLSAFSLHAVPAVLYLTLTFLSMKGAVRIATREDFAIGFARLSPRESITLVAGAAVTCGCYYANANAAYRAIVLLLPLPGLLALATNHKGHQGQPVLPAASAALVLLLWGMQPAELALSGAPALLPVAWVMEKLLWWVVITILAAVLIRFVFDSEMWQELMNSRYLTKLTNLMTGRTHY